MITPNRASHTTMADLRNQTASQIWGDGFTDITIGEKTEAGWQPRKISDPSGKIGYSSVGEFKAFPLTSSTLIAKLNGSDTFQSIDTIKFS